MRKENDWSQLESIFAQRSVCIREGSPNHDRAYADWLTGRVRYYSFPIKIPNLENQRGYMRFVEDPNLHGLILDFMSPYSDSRAWKELSYLAKKMKATTEVLLPWGNFVDALKPWTIQKGQFDLTTVSAGLQHHVYCIGNKDLWQPVRENPMQNYDEES